MKIKKILFPPFWFVDFAVGAPYDGADETGAVYIYHGRRKGLTLNLAQVSFRHFILNHAFPHQAKKKIIMIISVCLPSHALYKVGSVGQNSCFKYLKFCFFLQILLHSLQIEEFDTFDTINLYSSTTINVLAILYEHFLETS